jgi:integrase
MKNRTAKGLTISQRPNGSWRAQIRKVGYPAASKDFLSYDEADAWGIGKLEELRATGTLADRRVSQRTTFAEAIDTYIAEVTSKRPAETSRDPETKRLLRSKREEKALVSHAVAYLTPEMLEKWVQRRLKQTPSRGAEGGRGRFKPEIVPEGRLRKDGSPRKNAAAPKAPEKPSKTISPSTVRRELTLLKRVLDFAVKRYKLAANPMMSVARPAANDYRDVRLSNDDLSRLLTECRESRNPWLAPMVELAIEIGPRRGSLLKLRWEDVRFAKTTVVLREVKNSDKPDEVRNIEIGLSPRAVEILQALPRTLDGRVFPTTASAISGVFKRARARAGLEHFRFHDTRHEFASTLAEDGWDILLLMAQGGWRDPKSVVRYVNANGESGSETRRSGSTVRAWRLTGAVRSVRIGRTIPAGVQERLLSELCRKHGVSEASVYKWKAKYGGVDVSKARRLRAL